MAVLLLIFGAGMAQPALAAPPDGRRYELVSPPDKNGGDVLIESARTWAAADGNAVVFSSLAGFGDVLGTGVATDYIAKRDAVAAPGTRGWTVKGITPPQGPLPVDLRNSGFETMDLTFTDDLDTGVVQTWTPLTTDPLVERVANLYLRSGLRSTVTPSVELASPCPDCATNGPLAPFVIKPFNMLPKVVGMSSDGRHVIFESTLKLTSESVDGTTSGVINLYEYFDGTVRSVAILPDGRPAVGAVAGQGTRAGDTASSYTIHVLSTDGTRTAFTADPHLCFVGGGGYTCGALYLRDTSRAPSVTVQVNASERSIPRTADPAIFWDASADGRRVFFTSPEDLTDDDNGSNDLYLFDLNAPAGRRLTRVSVQDPSLSAAPAGVDSVIGASADGTTVYFTATNRLLPTDPPIPQGRASGIYVWRDVGGGPPVLRFVGTLGLSGNMSENRVAGSTFTLGQRRQSRVSADGRFLQFTTTVGDGLLSLHGGVDYDQGACLDAEAPGCREIYLYDAVDDTLQCVSCRPDGATATSSASTASEAFIGAALSTQYVNRSMSSDARRIFFTTGEALVPEDLNGRRDVYEWEDGQAHLLTDGQSTSDSYFLDASAGGADVFVVTRARLTGWDVDDSYDLYDVREGGPGHPAGVPDPLAPPIPCAGEACRQPIPPAPAIRSTPTVSFRGAGNVVDRGPHCRRGTSRKHTGSGVHCVRQVRKPRRHCSRRSRRAHRKQCTSRRKGGKR